MTCVSLLFNKNKKEELIRARTCHTSSALFRLEKPNLQQQLEVSKVLGPPQRRVSFQNEKFEEKIDYDGWSELSSFDCVFDLSMLDDWENN